VSAGFVRTAGPVVSAGFAGRVQIVEVAYVRDVGDYGDYGWSRVLRMLPAK
jgi:hypothetical protein